MLVRPGVWLAEDIVMGQCKLKEAESIRASTPSLFRLGVARKAGDHGDVRVDGVTDRHAAVDQRKNIGSNCSFTYAAMIEYDDPHRAAYRGHFAGIEGSNLARSPAPEERQTAPIPGGALTRT